MNVEKMLQMIQNGRAREITRSLLESLRDSGLVIIEDYQDGDYDVLLTEKGKSRLPTSD